MAANRDPHAAVAVFGSSDAAPGEPLYDAARRAGTRLAEAGWAVVNGGYGGIMEAVSRGARDAGGIAIGVTTMEPRAWRGTENPWLSEEVREPDLFGRTRGLVERAAGYLVLPGRAGTLAEAAFLWALRRARLLGSRPVVLAGGEWQAVVEALAAAGMLEAATLEGTWVTADVDAAVTLLLEKLR